MLPLAANFVVSVVRVCGDLKEFFVSLGDFFESAAKGGNEGEVAVKTVGLLDRLVLPILKFAKEFVPVVGPVFEAVTGAHVLVTRVKDIVANGLENTKTLVDGLWATILEKGWKSLLPSSVGPVLPAFLIRGLVEIRVSREEAMGTRPSRSSGRRGLIDGVPGRGRTVTGCQAELGVECVPKRSLGTRGARRRRGASRAVRSPRGRGLWYPCGADEGPAPGLGAGGSRAAGGTRTFEDEPNDA